MKQSLKKNYIYNLLYQILIMVLPLVTTPYLSRVLGAEKIGVYSFTLSILSYFVLFGCLGINNYGQRAIAAVQDEEKKRSKIFIELFILKFATVCLSFIFFVIFYFNDDVYGIYYKILTIELFSNAFDITWFYQGLEDFKKITIRNTIVKFIFTILIFLLVNDSNDLIIYFLIYTMSNFFGFLILWLNIKKWVCKIELKKLNIISHLKPALSFFIPQIAIQIYTVLDKTMLGLILNDMAEVGYYEQSQKIVRILLMITTAAGTVMIPRIANLHAKKKNKELNEKMFKSFSLTAFIGFPMCFGLIGIAENFVPWFFGNEFFPVISLLSIFSLLIIAIGFNTITGPQYLISVGRQKEFTISVVCGAIINFVLNFIFIPIFKSNGAAIASVIAEFSIFFIHVLYLKKTFNFKKIFLSNIKYLIFSLAMFVIIYILGKPLNPTIISTIIQVGVGGIIYFILLLLTKDGILNETFEFIKKIFLRRKSYEK